MSKRIYFFMSIVLVFAILFSLAGCAGGTKTPDSSNPPTSPTTGTSSAAPTGDTGSSKHYAEEIDILSDGNVAAVIDPFVVGGSGNGPASAWALIMTHDRLIQSVPPEADVDFKPGLAVEWSTDDYIHFHFKLREGVTFHNGEPFSADDVIWTYEYAKTRTACPALNNVWTYVGAINKINDYEIEIVTKDEIVNPDLFVSLSGPYGVIANEKAITEDPDKGHYIGTGPFMLTEFVSQNYWTLERYDNFWGEPAITRKLNWRYIPEVANRATMLLNGEAQLCMAIGVEDMELFEDNPDFTIFTRILNNCNPIAFNMTKPITSDYNFRMAVLHAIDKEEFAIAYKGKYCEPAIDMYGFWARYASYRNTDIERIDYDLEKAKEYLAKSSYNGEVIEIAAATVGMQNAVPVLQQQLEAIGVKTEIKLLEMAATPEYIANNKSEIFLITAPMNFMPSNIRNWFLPDAPSNSAHYNNPKVTELIKQATVEPDDAKREALWKEVQQIIAEERPYEHLVWFMETIVGAKGMGGFEWCEDCYYNMRYIYYEID